MTLLFPNLPQSSDPLAAPSSTSSSSISNLLARCSLPNARERLEAVYLGRERAPGWSVWLGRLRGAMLWTCLGDFLAAEGFTSLGTTAFNSRGEEASLREDLVETGPDDVVHIPENGAVFAERAADQVTAERAVFSSRLDPASRQYQLVVRSSGDGRALLAAWQRFARQHNPLRGRAITPQGKLVTIAPECGWHDVFLDRQTIDEVRAQLRRVEPERSPALRRLGVRQRSGFILSGPPGTGKTLLARVLAAEWTAARQRSFLWVTPGDLDSVTDVKEIFELARLLAPAALLLEDLDAVGEERSRQGQGGKVLLGELMSQIDGCHGDADLFVIATTNRADVLEQALRNRPGRFDRVIEVPPLGLAPCRAFLAARLGAHRVAPTDLDWLAAKSQGRTGAEIEELIETVLVEAAGRQSEAETFEIGRELLEWALEAAPRAGRGLGF